MACCAAPRKHSSGADQAEASRAGSPVEAHRLADLSALEADRASLLVDALFAEPGQVAGTGLEVGHSAQALPDQAVPLHSEEAKVHCLADLENRSDPASMDSHPDFASCPVGLVEAAVWAPEVLVSLLLLLVQPSSARLAAVVLQG